MATANPGLAASRTVTRLLVAIALMMTGGGRGAAFAQGNVDTEPEQRTRAITPSLDAQLLWSNNIRIDSDDERRSDFALTITPRVVLQHETDRTLLRGSIALPFIVYAKTASKNEAFPEADILGRVEIVDRFFFVEAAANVHTQFFNPFGARSVGLENSTQNRYTAQLYSVSPYIRGTLADNVRYFLRDDNRWAVAGNAPTDQGSIYTNQLVGSIDRDPTPFGWGFDVSRSSYEFGEQNDTQTLELARARAVWQPNPQLRLHVSGGYERNEFPLSQTDGAIYGLGFLWRPTERTVLDASWEHRFFGASYQVRFEHRTPRTAWHVQASRGITSYPEQLAKLPTGTFIPGVLDAIFASRIPDPVARAQFIAQFMQDRGLSLFLTDPLSIYAQQIFLAESASASAGLIGVRNSIVFSVYYQKTKPLVGDGDGLLPIPVSAFDNNKQTGATVTWTNQLAPSTSLTVTGSATRSEATVPLFAERKSDQVGLQLNLQRTLSPRTNAYAGARYQQFKSDFARSFNEAAVFVGVSHTFQ